MNRSVVVFSLFLGAAQLVPPCIALVNAAAPSATATPSQSWHPAQKEAVQLVRIYFASYEARDTEKIARLFDVDARIVRYYGRQIDVPTLVKGVASLPKAHSRFTVDNFEFVDGGAAMVVAFDIHADAEGTGEAGDVVGEIKEPHKFRASWILVPSSEGLRIAWANNVPYGVSFTAPTTIHPSSSQGVRPPLPAQDEPAAELVERFFSLFDSGNFDSSTLSQMASLFMPRAKLVHCEGSEHSVDTFVKLFKEHPTLPTTQPFRARAAFDHITTRHFGDLVLIAYDNHVSHWRDGEADVEHAFRETWLLRPTAQGLKALWVSYSMYGAIPVREGEKIKG